MEVEYFFIAPWRHVTVIKSYVLICLFIIGKYTVCYFSHVITEIRQNVSFIDRYKKIYVNYMS